MWRKINGTMKNLRVIPGVCEINIPLVSDTSPTDARDEPVGKKRKATAKKKRVRAASSTPSDEAASNSQRVTQGEDSQMSANDTVATSTDGLMGLSPDLWTEHRVLQHFETSNLNLPLVGVHEMHARLNASHKFFCEFTNAHGASCKVWMTDVMLFTQYPRVYEETKRRFVQAVGR